MADSLVLSSSEILPPPPKPPTTPPLEVFSAKCEGCGLTEECTTEYIATIRERYQGKWLCGLCSEAVKYEAMRCRQRSISSEEALTRHLSYCQTFKSSSPPPNPTGHLIRAMKSILRRSLESPKLRSMPCSPTNKQPLMAFTRSESCIASLSLLDSDASE